MPQKTNLNVTPYYDDYTPDDNYYKVLFKPGFPIQARELNNLQSTLQNQIEKFGDHFFKDGSVVIPGGISYDNKYYAVKINPDFLGLPVTAYINQVIGTQIIGQTSQITASVVNVLSAEDSDTNDLTLYIKYLNSNSDSEFAAFLDGELLVLQDSITYGNTTINAGSAFAQAIAQNATAIGSAVSVDNGIYFVRGVFAAVQKQTIILDQYSNAPSYRIGLSIIETTVNSNEDTSLYDNARGFNNFSAPGADRFKIELLLSKKSLDDFNDTTFVEILRVNNGITEKAEQKTQYNLIRDYFAERTYDESGDYTVSPFGINLQESLNDERGNNGLFTAEQRTNEGNIPSDDLAALVIGPGKAYVRGFDVQVTGSRILDVEKPRDTNEVSNALVSLSLGNLLRVNNVFGCPAIGLNRDSSYVVELYNQRSNSTTSGTGTKIGEARIYSFAVSDAPYEDDSTVWDLRLFDVQTYTRITLSEQYQFSKGTLFRGLSSGASGYAAENFSSGNVVTLHQTSGTFQQGEQISIDGVTEFPRTIRDIRVFAINDIKSVYQDASSLGLTSDFVADTVLVSRVAPGFNITDSITITASSGGVSTATSPGNKFTGITTDAIIRYQNTTNGYADEVYNRVSSISSDGNSMTLVAVPNVAGVATGLLPSSSTSVDFRIGIPDFLVGQNQGSLFIRLNNPNVSSIDLSSANLPIYYQIDGLSSNASGQLVVTTASISGISSALFETFDSERYSIHYSSGVIEDLSSDQFTISNDGYQITFTGLLPNQSNITLIATLKKRGLRTKVKQYTRSTKVTVNKSKYRTAGITTNVANGLDFNAFYGLRVEDEEISLNYPDAVEVIAIYESIDSSAPVLDKLTFETGLGLNINSILGEYIYGPANNALAQIVTRLSPTEIEIVYLNNDRFSVGEEITFKESGIIGTIQSITIGSYIDRTSDFILDKGQRADIYDYSRISRRTGTSEPTKQLVIIFNHYTVPTTDEGDAYTVLSYDAERFKNDIPSIVSTDTNRTLSQIVRASDTIDFRPRVSNFTSITASPFDYDSRDFSSAGSTTALIPKADESTLVSYEYYLPRVDRLILKKDGSFSVIKGTSSERPSPPVIVEESMTLAVIQYPPYLYNISDARIIQVDNKRYTMRDIGNIENRLKNLEEISSLSILENETRTLQIQDADGLSRFKSGFFADDFKNNDLVDPLTTCVVDPGLRQLSVQTDRNTITPQLAPFNDIQSSTFDFSRNYDLLDLNLQKSGNAISLRYNEIEYVRQAFATRTENVNPFNIIDWKGDISLNPATDSWTTNLTDTNRNTIERFQTINTGRVNNVTNISTTGPVNGRPAGVETTETRSSSTETTRDRAITNVTTDIDVTETNDPFIRSRNVEFLSEGLKPFTRYYAFLDGSNRIDIVPKLVEIQNVVGSFRVGETVDGFIGGTRLITFRLCTPNHKTGPFNAPETRFDVNPYDRNLSLATTNNYNNSSTFLNVDVSSLSLAAQGNFFGRLQTGMTFVGRTSNAQADLSNIRLITDSFGSLYGSIFFRDPDETPRFTTGTKTLKLTSSSTNADAVPGDLSVSSAETAYTATGTTRRTTLTLTETALTTTRNDTTTTITNNTEFRFAAIPPPQVIIQNQIVERVEVREPVIITNNITRVEQTRVVERVIEVRQPPRDPLAQTFVTDSAGAFLSSVDIYVATKDERAPLRVEIRTVELGTPTSILASREAFRVLSPSEVLTSDDASVATNVKFPTPIPLEPNTEYAIVLLSPTSDKYTVWIANLGERAVNSRDLGGGSESIFYTRQYGAGSLFKSQNGSTWSPSQFEDMMFKVNKCQFVAESGTATFYNPNITFDSGILPVLSPNPIKTLPRKLSVGINTATTSSMQSILTIGRKVGSGSTVTGFIENFGGPIGNMRVTLAGTGYSTGTYSNVSFFSVNGSGSGAVGVVTVTSTGVAQVSITNRGNGYVIGETLGITTSTVTKGANAQISVSAINGYDKLYLTNVQGEQFKVGDPLVYYQGNTAISLGSTNVVSSTLENYIYSGNIIEVLHPSHGMKDINNVVDVRNVFPTTTPTTLTANITRTANSVSVANTTPFATFQGVSTSSGYALINNEIIFYNSIGNGTLGIATRGAEGTSASRHSAGNQIYPYEFNGISLTQINKELSMPSNVTLQNNKTIDTYYLEIDRGNRATGDNQLSFTDEKLAGGSNVWISRNIQYDRLTPRFDVITPRDTSIATRIRTTTGTSSGGTEPSFVDAGFNVGELNATLLYPSPRIVASRVNEVENLDGLPRNKSLTIEVDLSTTNSNYSPFIYLDNVAVDFDRSRLNNPIQNYPVDGRVNSINNDPHSAIYVSQRINLKNPATSLKVLTAAYVDSSADIRALYRIFTADSANIEPTFQLFPGYDNLRDIDGDGFGDEVIDPARNSGRPDAFVSPSTNNEFREYQFTADNLPEFLGYQIKIVFSGTNESFAPRLNDIRTIALA
jgi:hypothetical protein